MVTSAICYGLMPQAKVYEYIGLPPVVRIISYITRQNSNSINNSALSFVPAFHSLSNHIRYSTERLVLHNNIL